MTKGLKMERVVPVLEIGHWFIGNYLRFGYSNLVIHPQEEIR
jgi:hypothetical protein